MSFHPVYTEHDLTFLIGTVGGGNMTASSAALSNVGFTPLPGRSLADYFTAADVGRIVTVLGAGVSGKILIARIASFIDSQNVVLDTAASTSVTDGSSNTTVYRPLHVKEGSVSVEFSLTNRINGNFTTEQSSSAKPPVAGQPLLILSADTSTTDVVGALAGGEIDKVTTSNMPGQPTRSESACGFMSYECIPMRRVLQAHTYTSLSMAAIATDIRDRGLTDECMEIVSLTGPTPAEVQIDDLSYVGDALDLLVKNSSDDTNKYFWYTDAWRRIHLSKQGATAAPWNIDDRNSSHGNIQIQVRGESSRDKVANQIYLKVNRALSAPKTSTGTYTAVATFVKVTIAIPDKCGAVPAITVAGVSKAVWVSPTDPRQTGTYEALPAGYDWAWPINSDFLYTIATAPTGPEGIHPGQTWVITYQTVSEANAFYSYAASVTERSTVQGGSGKHETVIETDNPISLSTVEDQAETVAKAMGVIPKSMEVETYRGGLLPGMSIVVHIVEIDVLTDMVVQSATLSSSEGYLLWTYTLASGALVPDWKASMIEALGGTPRGGGAGASSGLTEADILTAAPEVLSASLTVGYGSISNAAAWGVSGTITLDATNADFSKTSKLHVIITLPDGSTPDVCPAIPASLFGSTTATFSGQVKFLQDATARTLHIKIYAENLSGQLSPSPLDVTVTVRAAAVTSVAGREIASTLQVDPNTRLVTTSIGIISVINGGQVDVVTDFYLSLDNGLTYYWRGAERLTAVGQELTTRYPRPETSAFWKVATLIGEHGPLHGDPSVQIPFGSMPSGAVISGSFAVAGLAAPASGLAISITVGGGAGGTYPYDAEVEEHHYFKIPSISYNDAAIVSVVDAYFVRLTARDRNAAGAYIGPEHEFAGTNITGVGGTHTWELIGEYGDDGFSYTRSGDIADIEIKLYVSSRKNQATNAYSDATTSTLEDTAIIVVAVGGAVPSGALSTSRLSGTVSNPLAVSTTGGDMSTSPATFGIELVNPSVPADIATHTYFGFSVANATRDTNLTATGLQFNGFSVLSTTATYPDARFNSTDCLDITIDNNQSYRQRDSGGTARDLITLASDDNLYIDNRDNSNDIFLRPASGRFVFIGNGGAEVLAPNGTVDVGSSSYRWRDLYLSGIVQEMNGSPTEGIGVPGIYEVFDQTFTGNASGSLTLPSGASIPAGMWRLSIYALNIGYTTGLNDIHVAWNDGSYASGNGVSLGYNGAGFSDNILYTSGGGVTWTYTHGSGSLRARIVLERLT